MRGIARYLAIALAVTALVGCAGNVIRRPQTTETLCQMVRPPDDGRISQEDPAAWEACRLASLEIGPTTPNDPSYRLAIVELDDQGRLRSDRQLDHLFEVLNRAVADPQFGGVSLLGFVHGLGHNANIADPNP